MVTQQDNPNVHNRIVIDLVTNTQNPSNMASSCCHIPPIIVIFVGFLLVVSVDLSFSMSSDSGGGFPMNQTFRPSENMEKMKRIRGLLRKINKPFVKTIKSPDGDLIDCVLSHQQPAFDHPKLIGQNPLYRPERPKGLNSTTPTDENFQLWTISGESCPDGTIPIRRTTEKDIMRASTLMRFGKKAIKPALRVIRRDSSSSGHEHAIGYVMGDLYYGAKASLNVWSPHVVNGNEFSLSQMWVIAGSFHGDDLNTIEAGWQVSPEVYGDNHPRFFTYWTTDAYRATGCYNLLCSGFIQTNNKIAIGAAINPTSIYNGGQFDISLLVWKDPKRGHWWLEMGSGVLVGYWPSFLFSHLAKQASMVQFGGEIVNTRPSGFHTSTQMGSGHFPEEGFRKSSYFRNLQVVDWDNNLLPPSNLRIVADHPNCYDIKQASNRAWGFYFYYGGPGRNVRCP